MRHRRPALIRHGWLWASLAGMAALLLAGTGEAQQRAGGAPAAGASVDRGKYLVSITGCHDCHSPKTQGMTPDPDRLLSGRPEVQRPEFAQAVVAPEIRDGREAQADGEPRRGRAAVGLEPHEVCFEHGGLPRRTDERDREVVLGQKGVQPLEQERAVEARVAPAVNVAQELLRLRKQV